MEKDIGKLDLHEPNQDIVFLAGDKKIITINDLGIRFHLDNFPDYSPDDFAKEFIRILENGFGTG